MCFIKYLMQFTPQIHGEQKQQKINGLNILSHSQVRVGGEILWLKVTKFASVKCYYTNKYGSVLQEKTLVRVLCECQ